ncbi:hypothetical protein KIN20_027022 [Parelaphostrongylus tenuis]|uniref:Uncharacterized protein n=1 Tax=Parelaphostrongylus tenuis TaxID=148309 RepID=A0AAD5WDG6_PARTN|nr:hypothetical protein KIN20_027022 [Parelaphostrongylus tenuis]
MDKIQAVKEQFQRKLEAYEKKNRLLSARVGLLMKEKEAAEELADGCLRDRVVMLANKLPDGPERTLKESLYAADNAVCAQCQINEEMRTHLADEVAEKKRLLEKCQKECSDVRSRSSLFCEAILSTFSWTTSFLNFDNFPRFVELALFSISSTHDKPVPFITFSDLAHFFWIPDLGPAA